MNSVLEATPPRFTTEDAARIATELFGIGGSASVLGSERDQAFLLEGGVLKISNRSEDAAMLDLEEAAIVHVATLDPDLPVARLLAPRATFDGHEVRLFERLHGHKAGPELDEAALREIAAVHARLCLALRSFFHPAAGRELLWNLRAAPRLRPLLDEIADPARRALVARASLLRGRPPEDAFRVARIALDGFAARLPLEPLELELLGELVAARLAAIVS